MNGGGFIFSFDYTHEHRFNLSLNETTNKGKKRIHKLQDANKENTDDSDEDDEWFRDPIDFQKIKSNPMPITKSLEQQIRNKKESKQKPLHSTIRDDYFDEEENEMDDDIISPIKLTSTPRSPPLQRSRSKSMGSFAETIDKNIEIKHIVADKGNDVDANKRSGTRISSPIYKELAESKKKLTLVTFGPSRRPTHGRIHCAIKVEAYDFKGQCCIAFEWNDFGKEVESSQEVDLFYHGVPLYDKTGQPMKCKIKYKLSLIDTQISFDYD